MRRTLAIVLASPLILAMVGLPAAQRRPAFEVASIKKALSSDVPGGIRPIGPGGQFRAVLTVRDLIRVAYGAPLALLDSQIVEGPRWVDVDRFEIIAKTDGSLTDVPGGPPIRLLEMMRTLLADRFKLLVRKETRQLAVYDLVLDTAATNRGPRLRVADGKCLSAFSGRVSLADPSRLCGFTRMAPGGISAQGMTLDVFASGISARAEVERVVRNRTGLSETFDLDLDYTPGLGTASELAADARPTLFTAIREQLGLRLQSAVGPVDVIVIEAVERPTED